MARSPNHPSSDFGDDDPTVIDGAPFVEAANENVTPVEMPRCVECGAVCFEDDFTEAALAIGLDRCVRSRPNVERPWHWCAGYSPTHDKFVELVPKKR